MDELLQLLAIYWDGERGATEEEIRHAEQELAVSFPADYRRMLEWSNGGEGPAGDLYLSLWRTGDLKGLNDDYAIAIYLPHVVGIGTDGGGDCFALDYRDGGTPKLVSVPLGDLDAELVTFLAGSLEAALRTNLGM